MADQIPPKNPNASDEIDLGQLLELIKRGFAGLGNFMLRIFIFLKKQAYILLGLIALGVAIGIGLNNIISKKLKNEIIVRPNFESKNYLYDVIDEINANIKTKNIEFFEPLDISIENLKGVEIIIEPIEQEDSNNEDKIINDMKYLEVLENFKNENFVKDILRSELSEKSIIDHKITFSYKDPKVGPEIMSKLLEVINSNPYFNNLKTLYYENANSRIAKNTALMAQIDELVSNYSKSLASEKNVQNGQLVFLEKESSLNISTLLNQKIVLGKEIEEKRLEISQQSMVVNIINFGKTQEVNKPFFKQRALGLPLLLLIGFFIFSFGKYLNRKAIEIETE